MRSQKRVLIIAYHFPPDPAAGSVRPGFLSRYLADFGWEPTVLTKEIGERGKDDHARIVETRDLLERPLWPGSKRAAERGSNGAQHRPGTGSRVKNLLKNIVWFPDRAVGWLPTAVTRALDITKRIRFDAVISTSPPATAHIVGWIIARRRKLPWIADYRDLWYGNPHTESGTIRQRVERWVERRLLRRANRVTTVRDYYLAQQCTVFGKAGETIPNAYDPTEWEGYDANPPAAFDLCYAGTLYGGKRRLDLLFSAVARLRAIGDPAGTNARFHIYGPDDALVRQLAADCGIIGDLVSTHGQVPRHEALAAERKAATVLIPLSLAPETAHDLCSKIFECVGARRWVVAIGPPGSDIEAFIKRHGLGWFASDEAGCAEALRAAYARYAAQDFVPEIQAAGEITTAKELAAQFARLLDAVVISREEFGAIHDDGAASAEAFERSMAAAGR